MPEPRIAACTVVKGGRSSIHQEEAEPARDKATFFFQGLEHTILVLSHSPWASARRRQCGLELPEGCLEKEALGREVVGLQPGYLC